MDNHERLKALEKENAELRLALADAQRPQYEGLPPIAACRHLMDRFPTMIWQAGADGTCEYLNAAWFDFTGRNIENVVGDAWLTSLHPADRDRFRGAVCDAIVNQRGFEAEYRLRHRDGAYRWVSHQGAPLVDAQGRFAGYVAFCFDQSRNRTQQFERKLQAKEHDLLSEKLQTVLERMPVGCLVLDPQLKVTYWNPAAQRIFGFGKEEMLGNSPLQTIVPEEALSYAMAAERSMRTDESVVAVHQNRTKDGRLITCEWHNLTLRNPDGVVNGFVSMVFDLTEGVQSQEALRQSALIQEELNSDLVGTLKVVEDALTARIVSETALLRNQQELKKLNSELKGILDAVEESLVLFSPDLEVVWSNGRAQEIDPAAGADPPHNVAYFNHVRDCFRQALPFTDQILREDGEILDLGLYPIFDEEGGVQSVLEVTRNVTRMINQQAQGVRTAHLISLGELAAGVAHEINNPTHGIINYAEHLMRKFPAEPRVQEIGARIIKESERIAHIVRGLLDFSRRRDEGKVPVAIEDVVDEALTLCKSQLRKDNIRLFVNRDEAPLPRVLADAQHIIQVILNLVSNARYALNEKYPGLDMNKSITLQLGQRVTPGGTFVEVVVRDEGNGIPEKVRHKVLNPFYTTKPGGLGTGLGLSVSNTIVTDHGGRLEIASKEGEWTTASILLPAWRPDES